MDITIELEDDEKNVEEPLGSVTISAGESWLIFQTVYLDDVFSALIKAYIACLAGDSSPVSLDTEPDSISIQRDSHGLKIKYACTEIMIPDVNEFEEKLRTACRFLVESFPGVPGESTGFDPVRDFLAR